MSQFNWQKDAEDNWEETVVYTPGPKPRPPRRRWWLIPIILLALGVAGWLVYRQASQRVAQATTAVTNDVLSSHSLLLQAAYKKDTDLFVALLSGRNAQWTAAQEAMLPADTFFDRPSFGLYATFARQPDLTTTENRLISLDFEPDLLAAELLLSQAYTYTLPDGRNQTTTLQQTAVYRQGSQRWLYAPPEDDFWGTTTNYERDGLLVVYPARDEALAQRLSVDLEQMLKQLCNTIVDINCPDDMSVTLVLSPDPDTLVSLTQPQTLWASGLRVVLPTPTLVGLPMDEAGYKALLRGYSSQVASAVITHLVRWECCDGAPFYQALLHYQLSQLDLRAWPVTVDNYQRVLDEEISLRTIVPYWRRDNLEAVDPADRWLIYTVVDFLLRGSTRVSPAAAQRNLYAWRSPLPWLEAHVLPQNGGPGITSSALLNKWVTTATNLNQANTDSVPTVLPQQDLQLVCSSNDNLGRESTTLYRYNIATGEWLTELTQVSLPVASPLPDDSGLVLLNFDEEPIGLFIWQDGEISQEIDSEGNPFFSFGQVYPTGQLLAYDIGESGDSATPQLIDLEQCEGNHCLVEEKPGLLAWSPDGHQTIVADPFLLYFNTLPVNDRRFLFNGRPVNQQPYTLYRTNGSQRLPIGAGYEPFWIDNETYGYIRPSATGNPDIVIANTADDVPHILVTEDTLRFSLSDDLNFAPNFHINYVQVDPHDPERLFILTTSGPGDSSQAVHIFSLNWRSRRFSLLLTDTFLGIHTLNISPDGRWLVTNNWRETFAGEPVNQSSIRLYDLAQHRSQLFVTVFPSFFPGFLYDWSADGHWLAMMADDDKIALTLPGTNYYEIIQHEYGPCISLAWINAKE